MSGGASPRHIGGSSRKGLCDGAQGGNLCLLPPGTTLLELWWLPLTLESGLWFLGPPAWACLPGSPAAALARRQWQVLRARLSASQLVVSSWSWSLVLVRVLDSVA